MSGLAAELAERARQHPILVSEAADHRCAGGTHSYVSDGRVVCWTPGVSDGDQRFAVDAELATQAVPRALGRLWGSSDPAVVWPRWCATELVAKLADVPVVMLLRGAPVVASPIAVEGRTIHWITREIGDLVVALGLSTPLE